jgi:hypothetical protein
MQRDLRAALGWTSVQLVERPTSAPPRGWVIDDAIEGLSAYDLRDVRSELRSLQAAGIPPDEDMGRPNYERIPYQCPGHDAPTDFYVLKCKPSGWRLYFIVDESKRQFTFLYAVHKKTNKRDSEDIRTCCRRLARLNELAAARVPCLDHLPAVLVS